MSTPVLISFLISFFVSKNMHHTEVHTFFLFLIESMHRLGGKKMKYYKLLLKKLF